MAHINPNPGEMPIMIKTIGLLTRKDGWTHEQFMKHWVDIHAPLALAVPGLRRYVQNHIYGARTRPDIPTTAEAGYPQIEGDSWVGLLAPAGTPNEIIGALRREIVAIIALPDVKERLPALGFEAVGSTPEEFASRIKVETEIWGKVIRAANIKPE